MLAAASRRFARGKFLRWTSRKAGRWACRAGGEPDFNAVVRHPESGDGLESKPARMVRGIAFIGTALILVRPKSCRIVIADRFARSDSAHFIAR